MNEIPVVYFLKELWSQPYYLQNGTKAQFEPIGDDTGVMATNDANLIFQLSNAAHKHVGGIVRLSQPQYDELKKNRQPVDLEQLSKPKERRGIQAAHNLTPDLNDPFRNRPAEVAPPVAANAEPLPMPPPSAPAPVRRGRLKAQIPTQ